jgi:hypothetical protein
MENITSNNSYIVECLFVAVGKCFPSRCLITAIFSGLTILAFRRHIALHLTVYKMTYRNADSKAISSVSFYFFFQKKGSGLKIIACSLCLPLIGFEISQFQFYKNRGPLSLVRVIEELLEWKSSCSGLENRY